MFSKITNFAAFMVAATQAADPHIRAACEPISDDGTRLGEVRFVQRCDGGPMRVSMMNMKTNALSTRVALFDEDPKADSTDLVADEVASLGSWVATRGKVRFSKQRLDDFMLTDDDLIGAYVAIIDGDDAEDGSRTLLSSCTITERFNSCEADEDDEDADGERL